ncbi:MAG TPA: hypothetical protein VNO30_00170 [Kofleriaceae bacterium]|nr:hypothetical protein [Kofleriaceae bacterium]
MTRDYYPSWTRLAVQHRDDVPARVLADEYMARLRQVGMHEITAYTISGMGGDMTHGTHADLVGAIEDRRRHGVDDGFFTMDFGQAELWFLRNLGGEPFWYVEGHHPAETRPTVDWMRRMTELGTLVPTIPGFNYAVLRREQSSTRFVPEPPLARANHLTTVTECEIADEYENPDYFWKVWDRVETVGDTRVCIRALEALDDVSWLGATFESTMELVRLAKPKLTSYDTPSRIPPELAPWWEYGDSQANRAGQPALAYVGYEAATRTVEYTGFIAAPPYTQPGAASQRHVLLREIHGLRALIKAQQDAEGRPIDTVRIVFPFEWMARQERRPLLDAGARVFFLGTATELVEIVD